VTADGLAVLLLADDSPSHAPNVLAHIRALQRLSRHRLDVFNPVRVGRTRLLRLDDYDVVVVHYSITVMDETYLGARFREQLANFTGLKVQFIQDEYRLVDAMTARIRELGIAVVFTSVPPRSVASVYGSRLPGVEILPTLTGYVPADLERQPRQPLAGRPLDVVYRGRSVPYWLGRLGQDKVEIGRGFLARAEATELRCDVSWSEADRIYGNDWYRFLSSSRTTLGTESGASIVDFDGSLQKRTDGYLRAHPAATFEEVEREILAPFEGNAVIDAISPRVFEAAALGTAMVNFAGRYSDVMEPGVHYIPLEKDFSNFDEVVALIRDDAELERLASRAHADLVASGRYSLRAFVEGFDREIDARVSGASSRPRSMVGRNLRHRLIAVEQLRSPARLAQLPLVASARSSAADRTERRLIERFPEIEALAVKAETEGPRRKERLLHDLVRLAAAAAAHLRELRYLGPPFDVLPELDRDERRLILVGIPAPSGGDCDLAELRRRVAATIRAGTLEEIVWNNSAVAPSLPFASVPLSRLEIGYHVVGGAHRFTALLDLARRDPDGVVAALEPLFRSRPGQPTNELHPGVIGLLRALKPRESAVLSTAPPRVIVLHRVLTRPRETAALWTATARAGLGDEALRKLLRAYLGSADARADAPLHLLLKDFYRLQLIRESPTSVELEDGRTLVYRTDTSGSRNGVALDTATVGSLERIVWDHSAVGASVTSKEHPGVSVTLDSGVHAFPALTPVARRFPELALAALQWAAGAE
jgi:hypothetical protein